MYTSIKLEIYYFFTVAHCYLILTSLPKVIWEEGRIAALLHTYSVKFPFIMALHKFAPKGCYPFSCTDPQTALPASSLDASDIRYQTASGSDPPFFHNALDRPTDRRTYVRTDRSSTGKFDDYRPLRYESDAA